MSAGQSAIVIQPSEAAQARQAGARLIDIRADHERALGMAEGAEGIARERLERDPARHVTTGERLLLICQSGARSLQCAQVLVDAGFDAVSVAGGTQAWSAAGLPMVAPALDADFRERYSRHFRLPQVGLDGQQRLAGATVLIIGAGGLGSPAAFYLAAAGVGRLRIVDHDVVERSNLQRQILHVDAAVGVSKVASAQQRLQALNPGIAIEPLAQKATAGNIDLLLEAVDVVLDGADNFPVRYLLNDACIAHRKPLVYGAIHRFEGQVSVFDAGRQRGVAPCYRCLFPEPPSGEDAPNCAEAGVLGVLPGVVGSLQATEVLKLLLGIGEPLIGRLLQFDALAMAFRTLRLPVDPACPACGSRTGS